MLQLNAVKMLQMRIHFSLIHMFTARFFFCSNRLNLLKTLTKYHLNRLIVLDAIHFNRIVLSNTEIVSMDTNLSF